MTTHEIVIASAPLSVPSLSRHLAVARRALAEADQLPEIGNLIAQAEVVRLAARKAELSREAQNDWGEYSLDAQRKAGGILRQMAAEGERAGVGKPQPGNSVIPTELPKPTLVDLGVADELNKANLRASRWQQIASIPEPVYEDWKAEIRAEPEGVLTQAGALRLASGAHVRHNSGVFEWYTPPEVLAAARAAMGRIDLDPASTAAANRLVGAAHYYTAEDDGLSRPWWGNIWLNPPYAQPLIARFAAAVVEKLAVGEIEQACVLVNNATETAWFGTLAGAASALCLVRGRVRFIDPEGGNTSAPLQGQVLIYLGKHAKQFAVEAAVLGSVWVPAVLG